MASIARPPATSTWQSAVSPEQGPQERGGLLMATLAGSRILLLDEHTAALDPSTADFVLDLTRRIVVEHGPHEGLIDLAKLSTGIKGWTWRFIKVTVAWGEVHDVLLFEIGSG